jgi:type IX secretion system PorP/SprF family membrane protein
MFKIIAKYIYFVLNLIFISSVIFSQDVDFSQFFANKLYLNPAFAGSTEAAGFSFVTRTEWYSTLNTFDDISIGIDQYVKQLKGGVGALFLYDKPGTGLNKISLDLQYSYGIKLTNTFNINFGIQGTTLFKSISQSKYIFPDMIDPINGPVIPTNEPLGETLTKIYFDASAGLVGTLKNTYFGFAVHHIPEPNESFSAAQIKQLVKRKYTFHFGTEIKIYKNGLVKEKYSISPNFLYQYQYSHQLNYGLYFTYKEITFGSWFRHNIGKNNIFNYDAMIFMIGYSKPEYDLAYSYDFKIPKINVGYLNIHVHEVTFLYKFQYNPKKKISAIKCPKF